MFLMFYSVYFTLNESIKNFREKLDGLEDIVFSTVGSKVVARDFNVRAFAWGHDSHKHPL